MKKRDLFVAPIHFTEGEIRQLHSGDTKVIEKRLKRELTARARLFEVDRPRATPELKRLIRKSG
jgi:hypothetical protein